MDLKFQARRNLPTEIESGTIYFIKKDSSILMYIGKSNGELQIVGEDLSNYLKSTDVNFDDYLKKADINLDNYLTQEDLKNLNLDDYLKKIDLEEYVKKEDLESINLDGYVKKEDFEKIDFATKDDLNNVKVDTSMLVEKESFKNIVGDEDLLTNSKTVKGAVNELFIFADNARDSIVGSINQPELHDSTIKQISEDIKNSKKEIARAITKKGVSCYSSDPLNSYADKISRIKQSTKIINTKLNVSAPFTKVIRLNKPTAIENFVTTILEFNALDTEEVIYDCQFNNADAENFEISSTIKFEDGKMKQINQITEVKSEKRKEMQLGLEFIYPVTEENRNTFKIKDDIEDEILYFESPCKPALIKTKQDIDLSKVNMIMQVNLICVAENNSRLGIIFSTDEGITWKSFNMKSKELILLDLENLDEINEKSLNSTELNSLSSSDWEVIRGGSNTIRFAYYFNRKNITDEVYNDAMIMKVKMKGESIHSKNYTYSISQDGYEVTYTIDKNGTYTILYVDDEPTTERKLMKDYYPS